MREVDVDVDVNVNVDSRRYNSVSRDMHWNSLAATIIRRLQGSK